MGKSTGFMDYARRDDGAEAPAAASNTSGVSPGASREERMEQGGRCMDCGVPFCQSGCSYHGQVFGCPLHNLIPEWNDMIWNGNFGHALSRLLKNNNFPEFTGRVCPALCEKACTCAIAGKPAVTVRENELGIIEDAFAQGGCSRRSPRCARATGWPWWGQGLRAWPAPTSSTTGATASRFLSGTTVRAAS